jgi:hypothetical protein
LVLQRFVPFRHPAKLRFADKRPFSEYGFDSDPNSIRKNGRGQLSMHHDWYILTVCLLTPKLNVMFLLRRASAISSSISRWRRDDAFITVSVAIRQFSCGIDALASSSIARHSEEDSYNQVQINCTAHNPPMEAISGLFRAI